MPARFKVKVKCVETGDIYPSICKAAFENDLEPQDIRWCLKTGKKKMGKTFIKLEEEEDGRTNNK
jgi:hypothetical protein